MKTKEQLIRQLNLCVFTQSEWVKVKKYCENLLIKSNINPKIDRKSVFQRSRFGKLHYTSEEFIEWAESGLGSGDIVHVGRTRGVVSYSYGSDVFLCAYLDMNNTIVDVSKKLYRVDIDKVIKCNDQISILSNISASNMFMDVVHGVLKPNEKPVPNTYSRVLYDGKICFGYVRERNKKVSFWYIVDGYAIVENPHNVNYCYVLDRATQQQSDAIDNMILNIHGMIWNIYMHQFTYVVKAVGIGSRYYYLNDKFAIVSTVETNSKMSNYRRIQGNYFKSQSEAQEFLIMIRSLRTDMIKARLSVTDHLA